MKRRAHATLTGHLIGIACIGASLPVLVEFIGEVAGAAINAFDLPNNPGESGYLPILLDWFAGLVLGTLSLLFSLEWIVPNGATMAMFVFGVLLMFARPRWFVRLIARNMT